VKIHLKEVSLLLENIKDIDDDGFIAEVDEVAWEFGIISMTEVLEILTPYIPQNGKQILFEISEKNYYEIVRLYLALAIINYASFKHDSFRVYTKNKDYTAGFSRRFDKEVYLHESSRYFETAKKFSDIYSKG